MLLSSPATYAWPRTTGPLTADLAVCCAVLKMLTSPFGISSLRLSLTSLTILLPSRSTTLLGRDLGKMKLLLFLLPLVAAGTSPRPPGGLPACRLGCHALPFRLPLAYPPVQSLISVPVRQTYDRCHKYCVIPEREPLFSIQGVRNAVCSSEGRKRLCEYPRWTLG